MADAQSASNSGSFNKAREILKSAVSLYPASTEAWMSLADVEEKLGDWDSAYSSWDSLYKLAKESRVRDTAQASLQRVNDERVINRLVQSEQIAQKGEYIPALDLLLETTIMEPLPRTFDRIRNRYFEILGQWFSNEISSAQKIHGWKSIAVANFAGDSDIEGYSIRDRIYSSLVNSGVDNTKLIFLTDEAISAIQKVSLNQLSEQDQQQIDQAGVDAIVFGTIERQLSGYVFIVATRQTQPLLSASLLSSIPGFPTNVEAWMLLPSKNSTSQGLRVEVWTEKASYKIEDEVIFYIRSNRDCYVTLLDLQTSGGLYILFPNALLKQNNVRANQIYSIPASEAPFSIYSTGPIGVEGVKAIATTEPINITQFVEGESFIAFRTPEMQTKLCDHIKSAIQNLNSNEWDIAEWTFEITK